MLENLLLISKDLLHLLSIVEFTEDERNYIISVLKKVIDVSLMEVSKS
ncbi:hypothetical protein [Tissierella sp.]|nr:hypothetical protein [Tissierella sp.]